MVALLSPAHSAFGGYIEPCVTCRNTQFPKLALATPSHPMLSEASGVIVVTALTMTALVVEHP